MRLAEEIASVLRDYPRIYFACHRRHTRDPNDGQLVSERQIQILDHLDEFTALSLSALADHMGVTVGTMSVAVDRLVKRGYIARAIDGDDRRRVLLRVTRAGAQLCEAHSVLDQALIGAMLAQLGDADRARALDGLAILGRAAGDATAAKSRSALDHSA
jgi:DNA-binding MarR family transcriptional regulator